LTTFAHRAPNKRLDTDKTRRASYAHTKTRQGLVLQVKRNHVRCDLPDVAGGAAS